MKLRTTLCALKRNAIDAHIADLAALVANANYICHRCARSARKKKHLCKPVKLKSP